MRLLLSSLLLLSLAARNVLADARGGAPAPQDVSETESIAERLGIDSVPPMVPLSLFA